MKLPQFISIGSHQIELVIDDSLSEYGQFDQDRMEIRLRPMPARQTVETIRHEMVHAALAIGGISYSDKYCEESIVRCLDFLFWPAYHRLDFLRIKPPNS